MAICVLCKHEFPKWSGNYYSTACQGYIDKENAKETLNAVERYIRKFKPNIKWNKRQPCVHKHKCIDYNFDTIYPLDIEFANCNCWCKGSNDPLHFISKN